ncbi:hypothetical protein Chor_017142 [Crotalus horridus]
MDMALNERLVTQTLHGFSLLLSGTPKHHQHSGYLSRDMLDHDSVKKWGPGVYVPELAARGILQQVFPIHEQRILNRLMKSWVQAICEAQPLDEICDYFGVKIAMYFAWLGFYTSAMVYPAVFGSLLYTFTENDQTSRDICSVIFAIFNVIWSTLFLEEWKRRGAEFAYKWGTLDTPAESIEEPRPQFRGVKRISPVTNTEEFYYPPWKRLLFQCLVSLPICIFCLSFVFLTMLGCFELQEFVLSIKELPRLVRFLPKIMLAVIVTVCDEVYRKIAYWLNDMENYRLQSAYEKHLIIKMVLFLQNIKEVSQPHLYSKFKRGDFSMQNLREVTHTLFRLLTQKYTFTTSYGTNPRHPRHGDSPAGHRSEVHEAPEGAAKGEKKCLNGGCGVPEEEEEEKKESDSEDESIIDCGLKLKKVSFIEKADRKTGDPSLEDMSFLEEGSPTMVEKGMDPSSVFELCEDDDESDEASESPFKTLPEAKEPAVIMRTRRARVGKNLTEGEEEEEEEEEDGYENRRHARSSWIDPPEENYTTQLAQAEVESCMKKYEKVMEAMGVLAIVVNCYLIGQCGQLQRLFPWLSPEGAIISVVVLEKHERQAQHHFQQQQRRKREEEERQRHAEYHARKERESSREEGKANGGGQDSGHEKSQPKGKGPGGSSHGSEKPKRPSSLLATNNVMKLKQIIPLQGKFLSGSTGAAGPGTARSPQSPTSTDNKLPGFLSFKFLKSPETKREANTEKVQSPTKPFNPSKLFNFSKSEGGNGASSPPRPGPSADAGEKPLASRSHLNGLADEEVSEDLEIRTMVVQEEGPSHKP